MCYSNNIPLALTTLYTIIVCIEQEKKVEICEAEHEQCQNDLRLAFKRISDLQAVIEEGVMSDDDDNDDIDR